MGRRFLYAYGTVYLRAGIVVGLTVSAFVVGLMAATLVLVHGVF